MLRFQSMMLWAYARALRAMARRVRRFSRALHVRADSAVLRANACDELRGEDRVAESVAVVRRNLERGRGRFWQGSTDA